MPSAVNSFRNVISTRSPIVRSSASTSVSSIGSWPPSSKSTTANTIGGLGEYAMRSIVKVAIVPATSLIGAGSNERRGGNDRDLHDRPHRVLAEPADRVRG